MDKIEYIAMLFLCLIPSLTVLLLNIKFKLGREFLLMLLVLGSASFYLVLSAAVSAVASPSINVFDIEIRNYEALFYSGCGIGCVAMFAITFCWGNHLKRMDTENDHALNNAIARMG